LNSQKVLSITDISKITEQITVIPLIKNLLEKNIVLLEEELISRYKPKTETFVRLSEKYKSEKDEKEKLLACHASQKEWLDATQGFDSYLTSMRTITKTVGGMSGGRFRYAEGWRRHSHIGFTRRDCDPLSDILKGKCAAGAVRG